MGVEILHNYADIPSQIKLHLAGFGAHNCNTIVSIRLIPTSYTEDFPIPLDVQMIALTSKGIRTLK